MVYGPNEAGKSSWHAAIYAGLCGRRRARGPLRREEREFIDRCLPWAGDRCVVTVRLRLQGERHLEIQQELGDAVDCRAIELPSGRDVTDEIRHDGVPDAAGWLGLTRETLLYTLMVRQAEIIEVLRGPQPPRLHSHIAA